MANLFIAMGGSGLKTVREIREKHRQGDYFLFIDTDTNDLVDAKGNPFSEREKVDLASINVSSYLQTAPSNNEIRKKVDTWLDPSACETMKNGPLENGSSANRPQGRLAIASIAGDFKNKIKLIIKSIDETQKNAEKFPDKLYDFYSLDDNIEIKKALYLDFPVVFGIQCYESDWSSQDLRATDGVWSGYANGIDPTKGHAMCVIGYDDDKQGGAFYVMNSWGTEFGVDGYFWIKYDDFLPHVYNAYAVMHK